MLGTDNGLLCQDLKMLIKWLTQLRKFELEIVNAPALVPVPHTSNTRIAVGESWAHGAGLLEVNGIYYLIGENKTRTTSNPRGNLFNSVACYSSRDLLSWEFQNNLLTNTNPHPDLAPDRVIERPKAVYSDSDYGDARSGVVVSDTPCGDYEYLGSLRPEGHIARDMTLFVDDDSTAYLVAEKRKESTHFFQLSDGAAASAWVGIDGDTCQTAILQTGISFYADGSFDAWYEWIPDNYTVVDSLVATIPYSFMSALESPAVVKTDGVYYVSGNHLTGWSTNDNQYTKTKDLKGSWSKPATFAPTGSKTCNSQTIFVLRTAAGKFVYMGDRWNKNELDKSGNR
ncbi:glycosyl hydrolase family 43 [Fusarium agapanthi]|uniref:Glycosyl hydrolase family 43 n=1 Tax=Fusarium agapanthi TaxID=1803897 RepID=A0A9P5EGH2_9HYPO|nr:glycosyl hydrolase family 43 [Fusarium agapanthi]